MVLITGATGFLGAHLLYHLLKKGTKVRAIMREQSSFTILNNVFSFYNDDFESRKKSVDWVIADINDIDSLKDSLENISEVYHLAALVSFQPGDKARMQKINIEGTSNLVNLLLEKNIRKLCYVSSIAAIGRANSNEIIDEKTTWRTSANNSDYAISKYGAEREVWRAIEEGLPAFIINPSIILGPGEINSGSTQLIKTVEKGLKFYTPGTNGFVDVRDVVNAMILLMETEVTGERFILSAENVSYQQLFTWIANSLNKPAPRFKAGKTLSEIAWRFEFLRSLIMEGKPLITRETSRTAGNVYYYSGDKIKEFIDIKYIPIELSIQEACKYQFKSKSAFL